MTRTIVGVDNSVVDLQVDPSEVQLAGGQI
jgi:hypothetical protein